MSDITLSPPAARETRPAQSWWWRELRPLVMRLHFYVGLFVGPFLLVTAVTGLLYTITPQLEPLVHREQLRVDVPPDARQLPLQAQVSAALAAAPPGTVTEIRPPAAPDGTTRVVFTDPALPDDWTHTVFVDPYSGRSHGTLDTFGEWLPVRAWFDDLHRNLHLGAVGRFYSELAASWLWVLVLSGLAIWVARRRRARRIRRTLAPEFRAGGRVRLRSWHAAVGLWAAVGLLFLSATGMTWSKYAGDNVDELRTAMSWSTPTVHTALPLTGQAQAGDLAGTAQMVYQAARAHGLADPVKITPTAKPGKAWVVQEAKRSWPVRQDSVAVDPATGAIVDQLRFADWPLMAKLARWGIDAHMALLFGVPGQIALAALALGLICMIVWGYRMWWLRRPTVPRARAGDRPERPARASFGALLALAGVAIVLGVFLPVFGGSLLIFLLIDAVRTQRVTQLTER
ncbi:PepSY-associated TM helix domain-containing protein [Pseudonocardia acaciae]|uniref:PepSY-associated TM helix domain-containing protein n=1 Tax=Pseudonocardia acaciae TaxID=551276 RepID=UPI00068795D0|nr:PepSY-associated TM helix domain-containing protein [Pseudonocardia acaciae]